MASPHGTDGIDGSAGASGTHGTDDMKDTETATDPTGTVDGTVLVTGASGFLGLHLVDVLIERGSSVRSLGRSESAALAARGVDQRLGSVTDPAAVAAALDGVDAIYHLAGYVSRDKDDQGPMYAVHVEGTRHVLKACLDAGLQRIVVVSTSGTVGVGDTPRFMADEKSEVPIEIVSQWPYYESKVYAEREIERFVKKGLPVKIARPTLLLGPGDHNGSSTGDVIKFLCGDVKAGLPGGMSLVDVRDVAAVLPRLMDDGEPGVGYLLGAVNCTVRDFMLALEQVSGVRAPAFDLPRSVVDRAEGMLKRLSGMRMFGGLSAQTFEMGCHYWYIDSSRARGELGFWTRDWMRTLADTVEDLRAIGKA